MKRFHVHVAVDDLQQNIRFYSALFGLPPAVEKPDYAKWMLEDPRINFAISTHGDQAGVNHLGIQVDSDDELEGLQAQLQQAGRPVEEKGTACCYALSDKYWVTDPQGIAWEAYHTLGTAEVFSQKAGAPTASAASDAVACCVPASAVKAVKPAANACCGPAVSATACCAPAVSATTCCTPAMEAK